MSQTVRGIAWMVVHAIPVGMYFLGWTPPGGSWALTWLLVFFGILGGATIAQIVVGIGTAMADIADENELATGRRQDRGRSDRQRPLHHRHG